MRVLRNLVLLVLILSVAGCGAVSSSGGTGNGGVVTRALTSEPATLDPHGAAGSGQNVILPYIFDTLVYRDTDNTYKPFLAESWTVSEDGKTVTFKLRGGVTFHDGTALDAEAVAFSLQRLKDAGAKSPLASGMAIIAGIEAVDRQTLRLTLTSPSATLFSTLSMPYAGIVSPTAVKQEGDSFGQKPVGSGPFKLHEWKPGVSITLVRNADYKWGPPSVKNQAAPHIAQAVFKVIPDATTQLTALQAGDVDIAFVNQPEQVQTLKQDKNIQVIESPLNSLIYLGFNCQKPPFDDVRVRQALSHAVNKAELVQTALGGVGKEAFAPLSPTLPGFDPSLKSFELSYDPARAKSLLAEAGFTQAADGTWTRGKDRLSGLLLTSSRAPNDAIATILQSQFKAIGVPLEIRLLDSTAAMNAMSKGQYDLMVWRYDWNDADVLNIYLGSANIGRTNRVFYSNKAVDDLLNTAGRTMDDKARQQMYVDAQKQIMADAPWQPLYVPIDYTAVRTRIQHVVMGPMGRVLLNDVTVTGK